MVLHPYILKGEDIDLLLASSYAYVALIAFVTSYRYPTCRHVVHSNLYRYTVLIGRRVHEETLRSKSDGRLQK